MATQKRAHEEIDPDYDDACQQQTKRQRELEQDGKQSVCKRIQQIVRKEFHAEISNKELELQQVDKRLNEARLMMDRLRACVVANYYGQVNRTGSLQASSTNAQPPSIHPAVKKYLGKRPAHADVKLELSDQQSQPDERSENVLKQGSSTGLIDSKDQAVTGNATLQTLPYGRSTSSQSSPALARNAAPSKETSDASLAGSSYDDRRARLKVKKKIIIGNVSKYIPLDQREANDKSSHKWMVYVRGPKSDPDISFFVKKVWFFLHHSYKPNDLVEISSHPFHLTRRGWGEFPVRVQLHFVDSRNKKVDIIHHLKLDKTFSGLQTLGAETVVEVELERDFFESHDDSGSNVVTSSSSSSALSLYQPCTSSLLSSSPATSSVKECTHSETVLKLNKQREDSDDLTKTDSSSDTIKQSQTTHATVNQEETKSKKVNLSSPSSSYANPEVQRGTSEMYNGGQIAELDHIEIDRVVTDGRESETTNVEEYNVTIAHDTGNNEDGQCENEEEEMVVDVCDTVNDRLVSREQRTKENYTSVTSVVISQPQSCVRKQTSMTVLGQSLPSMSSSSSSCASSLTSPAEVATTVEMESLISSSSSSLSSTPKAATESSVQYLPIVRNISQNYSPSQLIAPSISSSSSSLSSIPKSATTTSKQELPGLPRAITVPAVMFISPSASATQGTSNKLTQSKKIVQAANVIETPLKTNPGNSLLNKHLKINNELLTPESKQTFTIMDSSSLKTTLAASTAIVASASAAQLTSNTVHLQKSKSLLLAPVSETGSNQPQLSLSHLNAHSPQPLTVAVVSAHSQFVRTHVGASAISSPIQPSAAQRDNQGPRLANPQKVIIVNPIALGRSGQQVTTSIAKNMVSASATNTALSLPKQTSQRQVSLLTGKVVTPQTPPPSVSPRILSASNYALSSQVRGQTVVQHTSSSQMINLIPKAANQILLLNRAGQASLLPTSLVPSQINTQVSLLSNSPTLSQNGVMVNSHSPVAVNTPLMMDLAASTQKPVKQVSLLDKGMTASNSNVPQNSLDTEAGLGGSNIVLHAPNQLVPVIQQADDKNLNQYPKMSAIGITKHGKDYRSLQASISDKRALQEEERRRNQYDVLKAWKENPHLYERGGAKAKKIVLAAKDQIEGEVEIIPPLIPDDYTSMRALVKAAVRLHPVVQAGVNKLTHPYCAESVEQWMSWPVGKQRASEWHRACFVLKYLRSCLGSVQEFRGERLMTTRQLVSWCRLHAFSPHVQVTQKKIKQEKRDYVDTLYALGHLPNSAHFPSFTSVVEVDSELAVSSAASTTTINGFDDHEEPDLEIVSIDTGYKRTQVKTEIPEHSKDDSSVECLPPSEGGLFVYDELRKRGIRLQPVELEPSVMSLTAADMIFKIMLEFGSDVLQEALAARAESHSLSDEVSRHDVHTALRRLPEASFCCNKHLGKKEEDEDKERR